MTTTALLIASGFSMLSLSPLTPAVKSEAANSNEFNPGFIISDELFFNGALMSEAGVQAFMEDKGRSCVAAAGGPECLKNYREDSAPRAADKYCTDYLGGSNLRASAILYNVARACDINPQVLLVTLQKERALVTKTRPTASDYKVAMGYGCPDTAACDTKYYGFANQLYSAARQFNAYQQNRSSFRYKAGIANAIGYHPDSGCGSNSVFIQNDATAALYNYTPYQPNQAALNNLYGAGDGCSSYGNRNFWAYFSDWFGSPTKGNLQSPSFEGGSVYGWGASNGPINQMTARGVAGELPHGEWFLATNTAVSSRAISQDIQRSASVGELATAKVWLRSESATPFSGVVAVWGLGGTTEQAAVPFTVTDTWTEVTVRLPVQRTGHTVIRLDIYLSTTGSSLWIDNASITVTPQPPKQNMLAHPSFEGSFANWVPGNGFMNQQIYQDARFVTHGSWFAASNTAVAGRSFAQHVNVAGSPGQQYSFDIWLRSGDGAPFNGKVALWGLGGTQNIVAVTDYTVAGEYTNVSVTLDVTVPVSMLKVEVYLESVNSTLFLDNGSLTRNLLTSASFENGSVSGWGPGNGTVSLATASQTLAVHQAQYLTVSTAVAGSSLAQSVSRVTSVGDSYTARAWVRAADPAIPVSGTFALWALGGTTEVVTLPFTADADWRQISMKLPITQQDHSALKFEVYLASAGVTLLMDDARLN